MRMCANLSQPSGLEGKIGLKIAYIRLHFTDVSAEYYFQTVYVGLPLLRTDGAVLYLYT